MYPAGFQLRQLHLTNKSVLILIITDLPEI